MKKIISLFLAAVMLFSVTIGVNCTAFAGVTVNQTIVNKNIDRLYDTICENGVLDEEDGSFYIGDYFDNNDVDYFAYISAEYDGEIHFHADLADSATSPRNPFSEVEFYVSEGCCYVNVCIDDDDQWELCGYAYLPNSFNHELDYADFNLTVDSTDFSYAEIDEIFDALLCLGFEWWDNILSYYDMSMADVGFYNYCSHSLSTSTTKATVSANGKVVKKCPYCGYVNTTTVYAPKTYTFSTSSYTYDGKVKKPGLTIKDSKGNTISSSNYTLTYPSGRKNVGKYGVKVTFKGSKYSGSKTVYFKINPKKTSLSSVTAASKGFTVKWKKQTTQTTGYEIQYSTSSKFTSPKTVTVSKNSTTSKKITKLKGKKKYYVRVRTYKTVSGTKYYSGWSASKAVTTKK